ncbi:MAG TPA: class I SAM-dependent methyltransferase [Gemmatimonadota bacterium]|nr:class I SAM-dependent methyltransferase [Gemmatimonadota bacterium]
MKLPLGLETRLGELLRERRRTLLLETMPRHGVCAEIGVWKGDFSERILRVAQPRELHLVDPWSYEAGSEQWHGTGAAGSQDRMDRIYDAVRDRFRGNPRVRIHRADSRACSELFADESLDWVYVDGDHLYDAVLFDLRTLAPKVKPGGFIAGDDLTWGEENGYPVLRAVAEFVRTGPAEFHHVAKDQFVLVRTHERA